MTGAESKQSLMCAQQSHVSKLYKALHIHYLIAVHDVREGPIFISCLRMSSLYPVKLPIKWQNSCSDTYAFSSLVTSEKMLAFVERRVGMLRTEGTGLVMIMMKLTSWFMQPSCAHRSLDT